MLKEAVAFHIKGLLAEGPPMPKPHCDVAQVEAASWHSQADAKHRRAFVAHIGQAPAAATAAANLKSAVDVECAS